LLIHCFLEFTTEEEKEIAKRVSYLDANRKAGKRKIAHQESFEKVTNFIQSNSHGSSSSSSSRSSSNNIYLNNNNSNNSNDNSVERISAVESRSENAEILQADSNLNKKRYDLHLIYITISSTLYICYMNMYI
jgi:hypothetical protein